MTTPTSSTPGTTLQVKMAKVILDQATRNLALYALEPTAIPVESLNVCLPPGR